MRKLATAFFTLAATLGATALAQDLPVRVGRVAHVEGQASLFQDPETGWEKAFVNSPITSENSVWTAEGGRAEVRISGIAMRLDGLTQLDVARLEETELEAFIPQGSVAIRVRHFERGESLVFDTPNTRVRLEADGRYRIDVDSERQETRITVLAGEARFGGDEGRSRVRAGSSVLVYGDPPQYVEERARPDDFDRWVAARDERWRESKAPTYVSTYMTGYEDLDAYGEWAQEPDYGTLWYPTRVASGWAPYRYGRWDYVRPWGWTWIDDAPWGYAPFHYGRWVYVRDRWAWHPGARQARPVWAPALVAWIGGSNIGVGVSGGPTLGWYPLSPWDRYDPWYRASPTYVNRVNIIVRDRDRDDRRDDRRRWQDWRDRTRERGATVVDRGAFVGGRPVAAAAIQVNRDAIRAARSIERPESVLPSRADYLQRRRDQPRPAVAAPTAPAVQPGRPGVPTSNAPPGRSSVARPDFSRRATAPAPTPATAPPSSAPPGRAPAGDAQDRSTRPNYDRAQREAREAQERAQREAQQQQQQQQRQQQQAQERAQREAQQQQQMGQQQRQAQERAQREAQQGQERAQREAAQQQQRQQQQQQQQQQAQERAQREAQQQQQRQQQQQQQQQQQAQERAQREAQQQQQRQQQQQQQQQAQERAQREAQQQQQRQQQQQQQQQQRQQQQQQQAQERAQREAQQQQAQERAQRAAQQQQEQQQRQQQQAQERQKAREREEREDKGGRDDKGRGARER